MRGLVGALTDAGMDITAKPGAAQPALEEARARNPPVAQLVAQQDLTCRRRAGLHVYRHDRA